MADTIRTRAQLLALLADNQTGDIGAQDMRDILVSLMGVYGGILDTVNTSTQTVALGVPEKLINFTENGLSVGMTPDFANNDLQADHTGVYQIFGKVALHANASNVLFEVHFRVDSVEDAAGSHTKLAAAGASASATWMNIISLNAGEKLSIWIESDKNCDITVEHAELIAVRIG
ncbi:MAG: hypothetical protein KAJ19_02740 [Gammaproteobacteria bacterium]|nr:hypothetical protein [Gammaproteobacteria bacterium]